MADPEPQPDVGFDPVAGVLALAFPGAGQMFRGEFRRGVLVAAGVLGLFFGGLLIGGLATVDSRSQRTETRLSFIGQSFVGPLAWGVNGLHQQFFKEWQSLEGMVVPASPSGAKYSQSIGRPHEIGVLYGLLAGMINFIAILDALLPPPRIGRRRQEADAPKRIGAVDAILKRQTQEGAQ